jgi:hypothetical protein
MIVASGAAGHAHAYWTLSARVSVPELERANRRLAHRLGGALASVDAARILRPASPLNHKHSPPAPVELIGLDPARHYEIHSLVAGREDPPGRTGARPKQLTTSRGHRARPHPARDPQPRVRRTAHRAVARPHRQDRLPVPRRSHSQPAALRRRPKLAAKVELAAHPPATRSSRSRDARVVHGSPKHSIEDRCRRPGDLR